MSGGVCPKCGTDNPAGSRFCGGCGFMLGSAPGGPPAQYPAQSAPEPPDSNAPDAPPPSWPTEAPPEQAFPDGTEGQGIWTSVGQAASEAQPGGASAEGPWQPPVAGPPYGGAPPAPPRKDNTLKIVLWIAGGCCGCILLFIIGTAIFTIWVAKDAAKNGGTGTTTPSTGFPSENSEATPGSSSTIGDLKGVNTEALLRDARISIASDDEYAQWQADNGFTSDSDVQDMLVMACYSDSASVAKRLLVSEEAKPNEKAPQLGALALHSAAFQGNIDCVAVLLANHADINLDIGGDTGTALHQAALGNQAEVAKLLLASGADINAFNGLGVTALHDAANSNSSEVARLLLDAGADPDTLTQKEGYSALMLAATMGSVETGRLLLDYGSNANLQEAQYGFAALHFAAFKGNTGFIKLLLEGGANPYLKDNEGRTPYDIAAGAEATEAAELLR